MKKLQLAIISLILFFTLSCQKEELITELQNIDTSQTENGVVPLPAGFHKKMNKVFSKYTSITAPNGRAIHLFAQSGVVDEKLVRAREILRMYLTDVPGSKYGASKFFVANSMADRNAALFYFNTEEEFDKHKYSLLYVPFSWQDLYASESFVEGSPEYVSNNPDGASYEEILHLTQGYGILPMLPLYQKEISDATDKAIAANMYVPPSDLPEADNNFEYLATIWNVYLGIWRHTSPPVQDGYPYNSRASMKQNDPVAYEIITAFFPEYLTFNARIHQDFNGIFHLDLNDDIEYTFKSQYLIDATLTGNLNSGLSGNKKDNSLTGNAGDNTLAGNEGNDNLDGKAGTDTAEFSGSYSEYTVVTNSGITTITDKTDDRDGVDTLKNIEKVKFSDQTINL